MRCSCYMGIVLGGVLLASHGAFGEEPAADEPRFRPPRRGGIVRPQQLEPQPAQPMLTPIEGPKLQPAQPALRSLENASQAAANEANTPAKTAAPPSEAGDALIVEAYQKTLQAETDEQFTEIVKLCIDAVRAGVNEETAAYARELSSWAFNRRGELYARQGDDEQALAAFDKAVQLDPKRWKAVHNRGISRAILGDHAAALADFDRTLQLNPKHANAYFNRGEVRYEQGDFAEAIADYSQALQLEPGDSASLNSRGHAHYRLGDYRQAAVDFTAAIKADPRSAVAFTNRGDLFADLGYFERAMRDYKAALELDPQMARTYQSAAWLMATCPDEKFRSPQGALQSAQRAVELDPTGDHRYLDTLAAAQANAGQFEAACDTISRALNAAPPEAVALYQTRLALYNRSQAFRVQPRELDAVADGGSPPAARQTSLETPAQE